MHVIIIYMAKETLKKVLKVLKVKKVKEEPVVKPTGFDPNLPENKQREYR